MRGNAAVVVLCLVAACTSERTPAPLLEAPLGGVVRDVYFVELEEPPLSLGGWRSIVADQHRAVKERVASRVAGEEVRLRFQDLWNGLTVRATPEQLEQLRRTRGVKAVSPVGTVELDPQEEASTVFGSDTQPELFSSLAQTGVDVAQNSLGLTGAGIKVAIVDTGTDFVNPDLGGCFGAGCRVSFGADLVGDAFDGNDPLTQPQPDATPNDCRGHGTHVAGIVMANGRVKGVAPGVVFGSYRVFGCTGATTNELLIAGLERAVNDGARVVNISLGNAFSWPQYPTAAAASAARALGVVVVSSQGNSGTGGLFGGSAPATGDDVIAAASIDNTASAIAAFTVSPDALRVAYQPSDTAPPAPISGTFQLAAMPVSNPLGCSAFAPNALMGRVALIPRGTCSFTVKAQNAQAAGAVAVVFANDAGGVFMVNVTGVTVPAMLVSQADGATLTARLTAGAVSITWGSSILTPSSTGGQLSSFSSFGPTAELGLKPDVAAPGGNIFSTVRSTQGSWGTLAGTSMASAHLTGLVALLLEAQPSLTPTEVGHVLRNTAVPVTAPSSTNLEPTLRQGAGVARIERAAASRVLVTPSKLALGESQGTSAFTRTLTLENRGTTAVTFTPSHAPALSVVGTAYAPVATASGQASVTFSSTSVTVMPSATATIDVTITPNAMLPARGFYGGYVVFTAGSTVLRVPYLGLSGDYQLFGIITAPDAGPFLSRTSDPSFTALPDGGVFTLAGTDTPMINVHLDHFSRTFRLEAIDAVSQKPWGTFFLRDYVGKDVTAVAWQRVTWDGFSQVDKSRLLLPNGSYRIKMTVLKALGDAGTPSDTETWLSPPITLNHP